MAGRRNMIGNNVLCGSACPLPAFEDTFGRHCRLGFDRDLIRKSLSDNAVWFIGLDVSA